MDRSKMLLIVAGLAVAVLASPSFAAEPPSRPEAGYEQTRELIRLGWLDLAERALPRLADPNEAALAMAWLAERRAGLERDAKKQLAGYDGVLKTIEGLRKNAAKDLRLEQELAALEAAVNDGRLRASIVRMLDPQTPAGEREAIGATVEAHQQKVIKGLMAEMAKAETSYAAALAAGKAVAESFDAYVRASSRCFQEMLKLGEFWPPASGQQKRLGGQIVALVADWLKKQGTVYPALTEEQNGVQLFLDYVLGHGHALAGGVEHAVGHFKKVTDVEVEAPSPLFRSIWSRAVYYKARTLADAAEQSKKKADWKTALEAIDARLFLGQAGVDRVLVIKARILKGRCLARLGSLEAAEEEYDRALRAADQL